jgi:hypothetical protein
MPIAAIIVLVTNVVSIAKIHLIANVILVANVVSIVRPVAAAVVMVNGVPGHSRK